MNIDNEGIKNMKDLLKQIQDMQPNKKKVGTGTFFMGCLVLLAMSFLSTAWITFTVVTILRLMDVI